MTTKKDSSALPPSTSGKTFISAYGAKRKVALTFTQPSLTKQAFKEECDINVIMRRYQASGVLPVASRGEPRFVDATSVDFQDAMNLVAAAKSDFAALPSAVRSRFGNDPAQLLRFLEDPVRNADEAVALGLATKRLGAKAPEDATPPKPPVGKAKGEAAGASQGGKKPPKGEDE